MGISTRSLHTMYYVQHTWPIGGANGYAGGTIFETRLLFRKIKKNETSKNDVFDDFLEYRPPRGR